MGWLLATLVAGSLQAVGENRVDAFWRQWSLAGVSGALLYLLGLAGEIFVPTAVYMVMPRRNAAAAGRAGDRGVRTPGWPHGGCSHEDLHDRVGMTVHCASNWSTLRPFTPA